MGVVYRSIMVLVLITGVSQLQAEENGYQFILGYVMDSTSLNINSRGPAMETTSVRSGGSWVPGLLARSEFNRKGNFIGFDYGYYFEYGLGKLSLNQGEVWDYGLSQYVDSPGSAEGLYAQAHQIFAVRSAGAAMGIGLGLTYLKLHGDYMVDWWDNTNSYESFNAHELAFTGMLFIEAESKHWLLGMRLNNMSIPDSRFYYDMSFASIYIGYKLL